MHYQKTFIFHLDASFGKSNRKQGLNLCGGQRLPRLACSIYATLGIKFSTRLDFLKVNNSSFGNNFRKPFWKKKNLLDKKKSEKVKLISQFLFLFFFVLNFGKLW